MKNLLFQMMLNLKIEKTIQFNQIQPMRISQTIVTDYFQTNLHLN